MTSLLLRVTQRGLFVLLLVVAFWLLLRGHNAPGGGFLAGVVAGLAFVLKSFALGISTAERALRLTPTTMALGGLLLATVTGLGGAVGDGRFLSAHWYDVPLPWGMSFSLGTPLLFEIGIFLIVVGIATRVAFDLLHRATEP